MLYSADAFTAVVVVGVTDVAAALAAVGAFFWHNSSATRAIRAMQLVSEKLLNQQTGKREKGVRGSRRKKERK